MPGDTDARKPRKDSKYSAEERKIIEPYKDAFRSERTVGGRLQILRNNILPAMFNYWERIGNSPKDQDESRLRAKVKITLKWTGYIYPLF
jgi:hypothetical protein